MFVCFGRWLWLCTSWNFLVNLTFCSFFSFLVVNYILTFQIMLCPRRLSLWVMRKVAFCTGVEMSLEISVEVQNTSLMLLLLYLQGIETGLVVLASVLKLTIWVAVNTVCSLALNNFTGPISLLYSNLFDSVILTYLFLFAVNEKALGTFNSMSHYRMEFQQLVPDTRQFLL